MRLQGEDAGKAWGSADATRVLAKRQEVRGSKARARATPPLLLQLWPTVSNFTTERERTCCEAGLRGSPVGLACEERARHVRHGPACVTAFLHCCRLSETLAREALEEQLLLGTSEGVTSGGTGWGLHHGVPWGRMMGVGASGGPRPDMKEVPLCPHALPSLQPMTTMTMTTWMTSSRPTRLSAPCSRRAGSGGCSPCQRADRGRTPGPAPGARPSHLSGC